MAKIDPKTDPRSPQDRPKRVLRAFQDEIVFKDDFMIDFGSSWVPPEGQNRAVVHTALVFLNIGVFEKKWS